MDIIGKNRLAKLKRKNRGNKKLIYAIDKLISDLENSEWTHLDEIKHIRPDADCVHNDGYYFFDINIHRTMILIVLDRGEALVVWAGSHGEYDRILKAIRAQLKSG